MDRVLVTGASGFLGGNLVRTLASAGKEVVALVGEGRSSPALEGLVGVEAVQLEVTHLEPLVEVIKGVEGVFHCDAEVTTWARMESALHQINVAGTRNVCRAVAEADVRLVYVSTAEALGGGTSKAPATEDGVWSADTQTSAYILSRKEAELIVRDYVVSGVEGVIVYPTYMLGPWDWELSSGRLVLEVATRRALGYPKGGVDVVDVRDVCAGLCQAMERGEPSERYILGGHHVSYRELFGLIAEVVGRREPKLPLPRSVAIAAGALGELWGGVTGREPPVSVGLARYVGQERYYDSALARRELDLPLTPLRRTVEETVEWFREHAHL